MRVEREDRDQRQRQQRDLGADLADRVGDEQLPEVVIAEQAEAGCHDPEHRLSDWEKSTSYLMARCATLNPMSQHGTDRRRATEAEAKALASAFRLRILRLCLDRALTNKEIAQRLDANPATVLHHVRTLVATGFLAAAGGTAGQPAAPARCRTWPPASRGTSTSPAAGPRRRAAMVDAFLDEIRHVDLRRAGLTRLGLRLTEAEHAELRRAAVERLSQEYADRPPSPDGRPYSLFLAVYEDVTRDDRPTVRRPAASCARRRPARKPISSLIEIM